MSDNYEQIVEIVNNAKDLEEELKIASNKQKQRDIERKMVLLQKSFKALYMDTPLKFDTKRYYRARISEDKQKCDICNKEVKNIASHNKTKKHILQAAASTLVKAEDMPLGMPVDQPEKSN